MNIPPLKVVCEKPETEFNKGKKRLTTYTNVDEVTICVDDSRLADDELAIDFITSEGRGLHTDVQYISIPEYESITICLDNSEEETKEASSSKDKDISLAEIKEFIDENTEGIYESIEDSIFDCPAFRRMHETLEKVKSMLDELELPQEIIDEQREKNITDGLLDKLNTKAKWEEQDNEGEVIYYRCSNCGNISEYGLEEYCPNCEAKMDEE